MTWIVSTPVRLMAGAVLLLGGCATSEKPRAFSPVVQPPPTDLAAFERDFLACASEVGEDAKNFRAHSTKEQDLAGAMGAGTVVIFALPFVLFSPDKARQTNEVAVKNSMTSCLSQRGYTVSNWKLVAGREAATVRLRTPTGFQMTGWRAWLFPEGGPPTRPTELPAHFDGLSQCQVGGLQALQTSGATRGGYACVSGCGWSWLWQMTICQQAWTSDRRTGVLLDAAISAADLPGYATNEEWADHALRLADKAGPVAPLPAAPPTGEGPLKRPKPY